MKKLLIYKTGYGIYDRESGVTNSITTELDDVVIDDREITEQDYKELSTGKKSIHDILDLYEKGASLKEGSNDIKGAPQKGSPDNKPDTTGQSGLQVSTLGSKDTERIRRVRLEREN